MGSHRAAGLAMAAAGTVAFSAKAIIVKLAYRHGVDAVTLIMYRMLFSLPLFAALAWWAGRGRPALSARDLRIVAVLGFTGYYLASMLDFMGLQYITASLERLILYLNPTLVLLISLLAFKRRVAPRQWVALALSYAGVLGAALVLGSAVSYAVYLVISGEEVKRLGALRLTGLTSSVACVLCIGQFLLTRPLGAAVVAEPVIWLSVLNAVACTFLPVILLMMAMERIGATLAAQTGMIGPVATVGMGALFLGEAITGWVMAGTALVLFGVWWMARAR